MTENKENKKDPVGMSLLSILFILLGVLGFIYYKSIDWNVLKRLEQTPLALPTLIPSSTATPSAVINAPASSSTSGTKQ